MNNESMGRRSFLEASTMAAALLVSGGLFKTSAVEKQKGAMSIFICSVCGHVEFGAAPEYCPVCHAAKDQFTRNDSVFKDAAAAKSAELPVKHIPEITVTKTSKLITETPTMDVMVRIGKTLHPMEQAHHIQWIDCYIDDRYISRTLLTPGAQPAAAYYPLIMGSKVRIVERCNLHGHWQAEMALM
jgi:superoxide reductase